MSTARHRELAEEFAHLVAERRSGVSRTAATERGRTAAPANGGEETVAAARRAVFGAPAADTARPDVRGADESRGAVGPDDGGPLDGGRGRETPAPSAATGSSDDVSPVQAESRGVALRESAGESSSVRAVPSVEASSEARTGTSVEAVDEATASSPAAVGTEGGVDDVADALDRADETVRSRAAGTDHGRVDDGAARDALAAFADGPSGTAALSGAVEGGGVDGAGTGGHAPAGTAGERVAAAAEAMSALIADAGRFAEVPEEGRWRFTLLDGEDDTIGFVVTRDAAGARSVTVEDEDGRHAPLLEELRERLAALDVDVTVEGASS